MGGAEQAGVDVLGRDTSADPCHGGRAVGQCPSFVCVPEGCVGLRALAGGVSPTYRRLVLPAGQPRAALPGPHAGRHQRDTLLHRSGVPAGSFWPLEGTQLQSRGPGPSCSCTVVQTSPAASWHGFLGLLHGALSPVVV